MLDVTTIPTAARVAKQIKNIGPPQPDHILKLLYEFDLPSATPNIIDDIERQLRRAHFDPQSITTLVLEDPAVLIMFYQHASNTIKRVPANPYELVSQLNPPAIGHILNQLRQASEQLNSELQPWLCACQRHSIAVSQIAAMLSSAMQIEPGIAAAAGLLHDLGRMLLLACPTGKTALETYDLARNTTVSTIFVESLLLGLNHKQLGQEHCKKSNIPAILADICNTHDYTEAQRDKLRESERQLATFIHGCDQIAKAYGLVGSPSSELNHATAEIEELAFNHESEIRHLLDQVKKEYQCRLSSGVHIHDGPYRPLERVSITFFSANLTRWNPYATSLETAGANILHTIDIQDCPDSLEYLSDSSIMVVDITESHVNNTLPLLTELDRQLPKTPTLLLTRRAQDHEECLRRVSPFCHDYSTPIRPRNLIQAIQRLMQHA